MKYQKAHKQVDEREKLRKFRELDDAFAEALRQLESPGNPFDIPTGPPVRSLKDLEEQESQARAQEQENLFNERLQALCVESGYSKKAAAKLVQVLLESGLWSGDSTPAQTRPEVSSLSGSDRS
ncbi:hypothetical protein ACGK9R_05255 [Halomonas sp. HNIBRBA4712]|uniref:hypothetical protein n=1 Tax=Halomonas sp. HNIBRBA4712 TaxID=3373087 RepID=UPI003745D30A